MKIIVVGAGPAGMMAAIAASSKRADVTIIEKNRQAGRKLILSGKGRCNLTNLCSLDEFLERFSSGGQFLRDAFCKFFNRDLMHFFEKNGLKLNIERQNRVFPVTNSSLSILETLLNQLKKNKVNVIYGCRIKDLIIADSRARGVVLDNGKSIYCDKVILATGGISYAFTGSTGDGIRIAKDTGHRIIPLRAGLVPLVTKKEKFCLPRGLTLKNIVLKFYADKKKIVSSVGEVLFTDNGISGPLVLSLSGQIVDWMAKKYDCFVEIDLKPGLSQEQLNQKLLREFKENSNKSIRNILKGILPLSLVDVFMQRLNIEENKKANQINAAQRQNIIAVLKGFKLQIDRALPIEEAMVTKGGVSLKDINPKDMQSRIIKGLYFCGEMIDVDADTGGFNLQAAFSTGYLAGESSALETACSVRRQ